MFVIPLSQPHASATSTSEHAALMPLGSACCACACTLLFACAHITRLPCRPCKFFYFLLFYLAHSCFRAQHCPLPSCRSHIPTCCTLELTTTTGPFLAYPPLDVPFASACNACIYVFTLHRGKKDTGNRDGNGELQERRNAGMYRHKR